MFTYDPRPILAAVEAQIVGLVAEDDEAGTRTQALAALDAERSAAGRTAVGLRPAILARTLGSVGHNLMRYRPTDVTDAILSITRSTS